MTIFNLSPGLRYAVHALRPELIELSVRSGFMITFLVGSRENAFIRCNILIHPLPQNPFPSPHEKPYKLYARYIPGNFLKVLHPY